MKNNQSINRLAPDVLSVVSIDDQNPAFPSTPYMPSQPIIIDDKPYVPPTPQIPVMDANMYDYANFESRVNSLLSGSLTYVEMEQLRLEIKNSSVLTDAQKNTLLTESPAGYTPCTTEYGTKSYDFGSDVVDVAYGCFGKFNYKKGVTGVVVFDNANFEDPIPGVSKTGSYKKVISTPIIIDDNTSPYVPPTPQIPVVINKPNFQNMDTNNDYANFESRVNSLLSGSLTYAEMEQLRLDIKNSSVLTDAQKNTLLTESPAGYTPCTTEYGTKSYDFGSDVVDVAYGCFGKFAYKKGVTGVVIFDNANFGDPIPGVSKTGSYKKVSNQGPLLVLPNQNTPNQNTPNQNTPNPNTPTPGSPGKTLIYLGLALVAVKLLSK